MTHFKNKEVEEHRARKSSPLVLLLRMWRRRCVRVARGCALTCVLGLLALAALSTPDAEQLHQTGNSSPECSLECFTDIPPADSPLFIQHIAEHVLDPPLSKPPQPLSLEEVTQPSWKDMGSWFQVMDFIIPIADAVPNGTYVEVGSGDGELFSLSSYLDVALGWNGLLVEPRRKEYEHARRRRKAAGANVCVSVTPHHSKFCAYNTGGEVLVISNVNKFKFSAEPDELITCPYNDRYFWEPHNDDLPDLLKKINSASSTLAEFVTQEDIGDGYTYQVQCFTLDALLKAYAISVLRQERPQVSLLVIDASHGVRDMLDSLTAVDIDMLLLRTSRELGLTEDMERRGYVLRSPLLMKSHALFVHKSILFVFKTKSEK